MPYINKENREKFFDALDKLYQTNIESSGDLNYIITSICHDYINDKGMNYKTLNEVIGVLECAKLELYRRKISPYEDKKIEQNGDV